jgi:hypothetical protein
MNEQQTAAALFPTMKAIEAKPQAPTAEDRLAATLFPSMAGKPVAQPPASAAEAKPQAKTSEELQAERLFPSMRPGDQQSQDQSQQQQQSQDQSQQQDIDLPPQALSLAEAMSSEYDFDLHDPITAGFFATCAEHGLNVEGTAAMVELHDQAKQAEYRYMAEVWQQEWESRPHAEEDLAVANSLLRAYGSDELRAWLRESPVGRHPGLIELLANVGSAMGYGYGRRR